MEIKGIMAEGLNGHASKIKVYPLLTHALKKWTAVSFSAMPQTGRQLQRKLENLRAIKDVLRARAAELGGYRIEVTFTGVWEAIKENVEIWCTPYGLHGLVRHSLEHEGGLSLTMSCRLGVPLQRKLIPMEEYFAKIDERLAHMPSTPTLQALGSKRIPEKWQKKYCKLVNAFGWNSGYSSKFAPKITHHADQEQGEMDLADDQEVGVAAVDGQQAAMDLANEDGAAAADQPEGMDPALPQLLRVINHSKGKGRKCTHYRNGGQTKAFDTEEELFEWAWQEHGPAWRSVFRLNAL